MRPSFALALAMVFYPLGITAFIAATNASSMQAFAAANPSAWVDSAAGGHCAPDSLANARIKAGVNPWNPFVSSPGCDSAKSVEMAASTRRAGRERQFTSAAWGTMGVSVLASVLFFLVYLRTERNVAMWHWGKILILWAADVAAIRLFFWSRYYGHFDDSAAAMILPSFAILAITWKWLSSRERARGSPLP